VVREGDRGTSFVAGDWRAFGPLLALHQQDVTGIELAKDGSLSVRLRDGAQLEVPPGEQFEPFTVTLPGAPPVLIVSTPGGGLAIL